MERHVERILGVLGEGGGRGDLEALLGARRDRAFVLGTFLAILELMKEGRLLAVQEGTGAGIAVLLQDSDAGRAALAALAEGARRLEEATPEGRPRRRPPWRKDAPGAPGETAAPPPDGEGPGDAPAAGEPPSRGPSGPA
jgi:hypothetical protein